MPIPHSPNRIPACFLALCFVFLALIPAAAEPYIDFDLSPNKAGQLEPKLSAGWDWNDSLGGSLGFSSDNSTVYEDRLEGLDASMTTVSQTMAGNVSPIIRNFDLPLVTGGLGLNLGYEHMNIRETGYFDNNNGTLIRVFFNNARVFQAFKPGLQLVASSGKRNASWFQSSITYVPYMAILFDQDFSAASAEEPAYNTPRTEKKQNASSVNAFTFRIQGGLHTSFADISLDATAETARYTYEYLVFGGETRKEDAQLTDIAGTLAVSSSKITIAGLQPKLGVTWTRSITESLIEGAEPASEETQLRYSFGFTTKKGE
ncbi:MAG TPA: hypothetical protein PK969_11880 [Treponemataceae bacterium]|nr:hypothetical protein [Treponemataceae bacterium]